MKPIVLVAAALVLVLGGVLAVHMHSGTSDEAHANELLAYKQARLAIANKHRAQVAPRLSAIDRAIFEAKAAAPVTMTQPLAKPTAPLSVTRLGFGATGNTLIAGIAQPSRARLPLVARFNPVVAGYLDIKAKDLPPGDDARTPQDLENQLAQLAQLDYALLVRITELTAPSAGTDGRFIAGRASGDAALYELSSGQRLGAFPFSATQTDRANLKTDAQLLQRFAGELNLTIERELKTFVAR